MSIPYNPDEDLFPAQESPAPVTVIHEVQAPAPAEPAAPVVAYTGFEALTPAGRVAALTALRDALDEQITQEKKGIIERLTGATENTPLPTPFGPLSFRPGKRPVKIDEEALLAYVKKVAPEMVRTETVVVETIEGPFRETLVNDVIHCGDELFARGSTGETIDYAYLGEETKGAVAWPASKEQRVVKSQARKIVAENMERLATPMLEVTNG